MFDLEGIQSILICKIWYSAVKPIDLMCLICKVSNRFNVFDLKGIQSIYWQVQVGLM